MSREKALIISRVRIEKYDENMELTDVHESKVPNITSEELNSGIKKEDISSKDTEKDNSEK